MERYEAGAPRREPEGCLVVAIRIPVRIVVLVLVVPVRMAYDALAAGGRVLARAVLRPLGRALARVAYVLLVAPSVLLWRHVLVPAGTALALLFRVLVVVPATWLWARLLVPLARGTGAAIDWLYTRVLTPAGHALARLGTALGQILHWTVRVLLVLPAAALWRLVLTPLGRGLAVVGGLLAVVGREVGEALGHAWRVAGRISRAVGRFLGTLLRRTLVDPARWMHRRLLVPVGHVLRDAVLRPAGRAARAAGRVTRQVLDSARHAGRQALDSARATVRAARADVRRVLLGAPGPRPPADSGEPPGAGTRTLGSSTTALTKD
ncbi:hypothetical protein [Streptomyces mangrovisoli]|uniref:Uncharacterized protein n=1 Tax=Streptomyces mangrovisoli TaxID=1428628 RepID=A0A1J4P7H3_9ACTN|nr:hypothetical protein [Streptomyces mangrovisoli]OIJ69453.1 hypothetical protein WN71_002865 [Streptomyces mangrovisoli]